MMNASASILTNDKKSEDQLKYTSLCFGKNEIFRQIFLYIVSFGKFLKKCLQSKLYLQYF